MSKPNQTSSTAASFKSIALVEVNYEGHDLDSCWAGLENVEFILLNPEDVCKDFFGSVEEAALNAAKILLQKCLDLGVDYIIAGADWVTNYNACRLDGGCEKGFSPLPMDCQIIQNYIHENSNIQISFIGKAVGDQSCNLGFRRALQSI
jgi:hypothetical protein